MVARSSLLLIVANMHFAQPGRLRHANASVTAKAGKPSSMVLLHGGMAEDIFEVLSHGIPNSRQGQKLGPGLYTTIYRRKKHRMVRSLHAEAWRSYAWTVKYSPEFPESTMPYVFALSLAEEARIALAPQSVWYGDSDKWNYFPRLQCLNDSDAMFSIEQGAQSEKCSAVLADTEGVSASECELVSIKTLLLLVDAGCVKGLKLNPERESLTKMERLMYNNHRASVYSGLNLEGRLGATTDSVTMKAWMCPTIMAQRHEANSPAQKVFTTRHSLVACGHALHAWNRGIRRNRCGVPCDKANSVLDKHVNSLVRDLSPNDARLVHMKYWKELWSQGDRHEIRKIKSRLIRDAACDKFTQEVSRMKQSDHFCSDMMLFLAQPAECGHMQDAKSIGKDSDLCCWI
eukprot:TRINITY_DN2105_c0_g2_i1.p1 TRINITY_DN2105_c0_g2~~TRINITY_DN2105_c0_g2_i1.p1  ORF type:complete len:402 (+),score=51.83 TRINITY_DN2105_c0_g2_i1:62-1267(+)